MLLTFTSFSRSLQCIIAIVVDWDIILQKISSHYATWVNYKSYMSVSSILKNKLS